MKKSNNQPTRNISFLKKYALVIPVVAVALFSSAILISQSANISRLEKQKQDYQTQLDNQISVNQSLEAQYKSDNQDEYIEQKAREKGYVKNNEIVFYDISSSK